jgi:phage host-nuclease inhibitor protein Gam
MVTKTMKIKQDAASFPIPQTKDEVVSAIAEIGRRQRERERIQAEMNDRLSTLRQEYETQAAPHGEAIRALFQGIQTWCESHREELTLGGKVKTANLPSGEIRWRMRPPRVSIRAAEQVLESLKSLGLNRFVRTKEEINKDAILAEPEAIIAIKGISISQSEDFVIVPFETQLEEVLG